MERQTKPMAARPQPLSETMSRLTLLDTATQTPLPPSSPAHQLKSPPLQSPSVLRNVSSPSNHPRPSPSPLRRSASSMSIDRRPASPALARRTSTASLRNGLDSPVTHSPKLSNRRSSSNLLISQLMPALEEPAPLTAAKIASDHFTHELALHDDPSIPTDCKTVVIIHDDCYDHRFSRLKTKDTINYIVERPERLQAGVMGISTAYVRLGERHSGGINAPHPKKTPSNKVPFRILRSSRKIPLHSDAVTAVHGKEWMKELQGLCDSSAQKLAAASIEVARTPSSNGSLKRPFHSGDLYLSAESINAFEGALGGVCDAVDAVFQGAQTGKGPYQAFACVRPPGHHCSSDWPSGFCWLNNVHVGIQHAIQNYGLTHAAIIDFDLHHGDGSQEVAWAHNERMQYPEKKNFPNSKKSFLGYFSLHDINSFPCELGDREKTQMASLCIDNAHGQAIWNVHLEQWEKPEEFWHLYETRYKAILDKARNFLKHRTNEVRTGKNQRAPRAAIFISAGFDASEHEGGGMQRHSVNVLTEFYARFTQDIVALANEEGTSVDGRVISVLEGGYSDKALISGVLSHISGLCEGDVLSVEQKESNGCSSGKENIGLSGLASAVPIHDVPAEVLMKYNTEWWHEMNLDTLASLLHPPADTNKAGPKKPRNATYSSPTHASAMRIVDPSRVTHRSSSVSSRAPSVMASRSASPPPPDVDWAVASSELCRLLIPKHRQINSCTQEDLNPKDIKVKKERTPEVAAPAIPNGRALRERKTRVSNVADMDPTVARRKASADRRQTIAHPLPTTEINDPPKESRRRLSIASTVSTTSVATAANARPRTTKPATSGMDIKKTRPSSSATSSRASSVKPTAVQRVPSNTVRRQNSTRTPSISVPSIKEKEKQSGDADIDSLTSGLKRITIKVPSSEEYATRQAKATAGAEKASAVSKTAIAKKPAPTRTNKVPANTTKRPVARDTARTKASTPAMANSTTPQPVKTEKEASPPLQKIPAVPAAPVTSQVPGQEQPPSVSNNFPSEGWQSTEHQSTHQHTEAPVITAQPAMQTSVKASSPTSSTSQAPQQPYANIQFAPPNSDIPVEQAPKQAPSSEYSSGLQWMPPNSEAGVVAAKAPEVAKTQKEMPTFSATGHIPFAPNGQNPASVQQDEK